MNNDHRLALNPEIIGQLPQGRTAAVHKRLGLGQQDIHPLDAPPTEEHIEFLTLHRDMVSFGQRIDNHETGIVAAIAIRVARITQTGN